MKSGLIGFFGVSQSIERSNSIIRKGRMPQETGLCKSSRFFEKCGDKQAQSDGSQTCHDGARQSRFSNEFQSLTSRAQRRDGYRLIRTLKKGSEGSYVVARIARIGLLARGSRTSFRGVVCRRKQAKKRVKYSSCCQLVLSKMRVRILFTHVARFRPVQKERRQQRFFLTSGLIFLGG